MPPPNTTHHQTPMPNFPRDSRSGSIGEHGAGYAQPANYAPPYGALGAEAPPVARRTVFTPYVLGWSAVGVLAAGYMVTLALSPDTSPQRASTAAFIADPQSHEGQRAAARLVADVNQIKDNIAAVQLELSKIRTDVAGQEARDKVLTAQLVALEHRLSGSAGSAIETHEEAPSEALPGREASRSKDEVRSDKRAESDGAVQGEAVPAAPAAPARVSGAAPVQPKLVNADNGNVIAPGLTLETASIPMPAAKAVKAAAKPTQTVAQTGAAAKATAKVADKATTATTIAAETSEPIDLGTPVVSQERRPVGVQISSGASVDSLRLSWSLLADRHAEALKNLEARYTASGAPDSPTFDLIAGPIKSRADAQRVCKALAAKNVPCKIGEFLGEAL